MNGINYYRLYKSIKRPIDIQMLKAAIEYIQDHNPYNELGLKHREANAFVFGKEGRKDTSDILFSGKIKPEHAIQRNIFYNKEKYKEELGEIIGYEVEIPGDRNTAKVDLLSIKDNVLHLIELKQCRINEEKNECKESIARALLEIITYSSFVDQEAKENLKIALGSTFDINQIKLVLLVPKSMADDYISLASSLNIENHLKDVEVMTIEAKEDLSNVKTGNTSKKYFKINPLNF